VGDSSTIFSKRRCAEVVRLRRINSVIFAMLGIFSSRSTSQTLPMKPVDADKQEVLAGSESRTERWGTCGVLLRRSTELRAGSCEREGRLHGRIQELRILFPSEL